HSVTYPPPPLSVLPHSLTNSPPSHRAPHRRHTHDNLRTPHPAALTRLLHAPSTTTTAAAGGRTSIKRRRLASARGGTETVYVNGPVYALQKRSEDCWRAIRGIDMALEELGGPCSAGLTGEEEEVGRLRGERERLESEYGVLVGRFEEEKR